MPNEINSAAIDGKPNVRRIYFLVLDKTNKVVCDFTEEKDAKSYVAARPYLRYVPFTYTE